MDIKRRDFLKIVGASSVATAVPGCSGEATRKLIPYLIPEEEIVPGQATWYATVCRECPAGCGMLVKTMEGRAIKVEGNPDHPVNRGRLCARGQASLQGLYNPDRLKEPHLRGADGALRAISWQEAESRLATGLSQLAGQRGRLAFVTPLLTGSLDRLIDLWLETMGGGIRLRYEPVSYESLRSANRVAFGLDEIPYYDIEKAKTLLSFGADFLETWLSPVEHARHFASMRTYRRGQMGRFVYVGPRLSLTAANSDEWVAVRPGSEGFLALAMIRVILDEGLAVNVSPVEVRALNDLVINFTPDGVANEVGISADKIRVLGRVFCRQRPSLALVDAHGSNATETGVAVNLLNYVTGNIGQTVRFDSMAAAGRVSSYGEFRELIEAIERGEISVLLLAGVNPLFTLPEAGRMRQALNKVSLIVSVSSFLDETASAAQLVLPENTFLESWGDYEPWEGKRGIQQPAMEPLYDTRSLGDILLSTAARFEKKEKLPWDSFYTYLRAEWQELHRKVKSQEDFDSFWLEAVRHGGNFQELPLRPVRLNPESFRVKFRSPVFSGEAEGLTLVAYPSLAFYDGRLANRPWLQELPDPLTQFVWDNWLEIHPEDAKRLGIKKNQLVQVKSPGGEIRLPAHLSAGVRRGSVAIPLGQGHSAFGRYAENIGVNAYPLIAAQAEAASGGLIWIGTRVAVGPTGLQHRLVSTSGTDRSHEREIVRTIPLAALQKGGEGKEPAHVFHQMYPDHDHPDHRWGMAIDLNACIGCNACVVACSAENNIPVVGKEQVGIGREMSWIRIQRIDEGKPGNPDHHFIPMLCQQCDKAPCEPVCPVYATYHNPEGLNAQVYNRCVGTRYCSNNCPYKVRRFNWFTAEWPEPLQLQLNPDVTVREMGVMEKCTFCVQRIRSGELAAKAEDRNLRDGEIVPACAQTCPTRAIVFGDLNDPQAEVSKLAKNPRGYHVLEHLNTQPAVTYLKKIKVGPAED